VLLLLLLLLLVGTPIVGLKILNSNGDGELSDVIDAMNWLLETRPNGTNSEPNPGGKTNAQVCGSPAAVIWLRVRCCRCWGIKYKSRLELCLPVCTALLILPTSQVIAMDVSLMISSCLVYRGMRKSITTVATDLVLLFLQCTRPA
jgi:hypothetical protein